MGCSHEFGSLLVSVPESDKAGQRLVAGREN